MAEPTPRAPLAWLLLPLITGYLLASSLPSNPAIIAILGTVVVVIAFLFSRGSSRAAFCLWAGTACAGGVLLAVAYCQFRLAPPTGWDDLPPREAHLTLKISRLYPNSGAFPAQRGLAVIQESDSHLGDLLGRKIYFGRSATPDDDPWKAGMRIEVTGVLELLVPTEGDAFTGHLLKEGIHFRLTRIALLTEPATPRFLTAFLAAGHDRVQDALRLGAEADSRNVGIYRAMLLGKREELTHEQKLSFLHSGTLHLFAISGLHIGVIALALHTLLTLLRVPPPATAVIGLSLLLVFVGITGFGPSAVRAFLMVAFFWAARFGGRAPNAVAALANSACLVLLLFPAQLWNPGFQLSYAVVAGILFLGLPLGARLQERWVPFRDLPEVSQKWWQRKGASAMRAVAATLAISLSATLVSSPLTIHYFGIFTPGAVFLNLLLIPAAALVIISGVLSVFFSFGGIDMGSVLFNHAAWLVISAMEAMVGAADYFPWAFWQASFLSPAWAGGTVVAVLTSLLVCSHQRWREPAFHFTVPFLVFVVLLLGAGRLTFPGN